MQKEVITFLLEKLLPRFIEIVKTPFGKHIIWIIAPLIISIVLIQLYFGRWKNEKLGWNSVLGNIVVLLFITIGLMSRLLEMYKPYEFFMWGTAFYNVLLVAFLILQIILITIFVFLHTIPKIIAFFIGSQITVFTIAFVSISLVYGKIPIDEVTLLASILLFVFVFIFFAFLRYLVPPSKEAKHFLIMKEKKKNRLKSARKAGRTRRMHTVEKHIRMRISNAGERIKNIKKKIKKFFKF